MASLATNWLGLSLASPLVLSASPLSDDAEAVATAVAAGAGAVIMRSLFEEQLANEQMAAHRFLDARTDQDAEARTFLPDSDVFSLGPERHLVQLASVLLERGPAYVGAIRAELLEWLDGMRYASSDEARGVLALGSAPDPRAWERLNYMHVLDGWRPRDPGSEGR